MSKALIDSNIYSGALRGDAGIVAVLRQLGQIGITAVSIGELLSGFKAGKREKKNRRELNQFLDSPRVRIYVVDEGTAEYYGSILTQLRRNGKPIPTNDIWIAAVAFQHGLPLYTLDSHFSHIQGLLLHQ